MHILQIVHLDVGPLLIIFENGEIYALDYTESDMFKLRDFRNYKFPDTAKLEGNEINWLGKYIIDSDFVLEKCKKIGVIPNMFEEC